MTIIEKSHKDLDNPIKCIGNPNRILISIHDFLAENKSIWNHSKNICLTNLELEIVNYWLKLIDQ